MEFDEDAGRGYELVYAESVHALVEQRDSVENLRTRAGILLSAAAVASSLLGGQALGDAHLTVFGWAAILAFTGTAGSLLAVLWPAAGWNPTRVPTRLIETHIEVSDPPPFYIIHRDLSYAMGVDYAENRHLHLRLVQRFQLASMLISVEVLAWIADLTAKA
jgi:hypothetical protein